MPAWLAPLAITVGSTLMSEMYRNMSKRKSKMAGVDMPDFNASGMRESALSNIGEQSARAGRSAGMSMQAQGLGNTGMQYSVGRGLASDASQNAQNAFAGIQNMQNQYNQQRAMFDLQKAQLLDEYAAAQPNFMSSLAFGANMAGSLYPMMNPQAFATQYNMGGQGGGMQGMQSYKDLWPSTSVGAFGNNPGYLGFGGIGANQPTQPGGYSGARIQTHTNAFGGF